MFANHWNYCKLLKPKLLALQNAYEFAKINLVAKLLWRICEHTDRCQLLKMSFCSMAFFPSKFKSSHIEWNCGMGSWERFYMSFRWSLILRFHTEFEIRCQVALQNLRTLRSLPTSQNEFLFHGFLLDVIDIELIVGLDKCLSLGAMWWTYVQFRCRCKFAKVVTKI